MFLKNLISDCEAKNETISEDAINFSIAKEMKSLCQNLYQNEDENIFDNGPEEELKASEINLNCFLGQNHKTT